MLLPQPVAEFPGGCQRVGLQDAFCQQCHVEIGKQFTPADRLIPVSLSELQRCLFAQVEKGEAIILPEPYLGNSKPAIDGQLIQPAAGGDDLDDQVGKRCLLYTSPSPRDTR